MSERESGCEGVFGAVCGIATDRGGGIFPTPLGEATRGGRAETGRKDTPGSAAFFRLLPSIRSS